MGKVVLLDPATVDGTLYEGEWLPRQYREKTADPLTFRSGGQFTREFPVGKEIPEITPRKRVEAGRRFLHGSFHCPSSSHSE
jgi:hypothetical protein